jgi:hypothetical protein
LNPNLFTSLTNWQNRTNVEQRIDSSLTEQLSRRAQPLLYIPKGDGMYDETCQRKTMFQLLSVLERELLKRANLPDMFEITDVRRVLREGIQSGRITDELVFKMRNDKVKGYKDSLYERARKAIWFTYSLQNKHCKDFGTDPYLLGPEIDPLTGRVRVVYAPPTLDNFRAFRDATELWSAGNYFLGMDDAS